MNQIDLPDKFRNMPRNETLEIIARNKKKLGDKVVILGHHYQRDEIIQFADYRGDSLELSRIAARQQDAEYIVFCGVHFMAESADVLTSNEQKVLLPNLAAGCPMADMATIAQVQYCWNYLQKHLPHPEKLVPVTYVNSSAAVKAFCGQHNGLCCTSGNSSVVLESIWDNDADAIILFMPDEHLGRNTAYNMGVPLEQMAMWQPLAFAEGGKLIAAKDANSCRIILWQGYCHVHQDFTIDDIQNARHQYNNVKVIVHPECKFEVVQKADYSGSTAKIVQLIAQSESGSHWAVGTETNLVNRLRQEMANRNIDVFLLGQAQHSSGESAKAICPNMYRISPDYLAWLLDMLVAHIEKPDEVKLLNRVIVPADIKQQAQLSLQRMLEL